MRANLRIYDPEHSRDLHVTESGGGDLVFVASLSTSCDQDFALKAIAKCLGRSIALQPGNIEIARTSPTFTPNRFAIEASATHLIVATPTPAGATPGAEVLAKTRFGSQNTEVRIKCFEAIFTRQRPKKQRPRSLKQGKIYWRALDEALEVFGRSLKIEPAIGNLKGCWILHVARGTALRGGRHRRLGIRENPGRSRFTFNALASAYTKPKIPSRESTTASLIERHLSIWV